MKCCICTGPRWATPRFPSPTVDKASCFIPRGSWRFECEFVSVGSQNRLPSLGRKRATLACHQLRNSTALILAKAAVRTERHSLPPHQLRAGGNRYPALSEDHG